MTKHILRVRPQLASVADRIDDIAKYSEFKEPVYRTKLDEIRASLLNSDEKVDLFCLRDPKQVASLFRQQVNADYRCIPIFNVYPWWGGITASCFAIGVWKGDGNWIFSSGILAFFFPFAYVTDKHMKEDCGRIQSECRTTLQHLHKIEEELGEELGEDKVGEDGGVEVSSREFELIEQQRKIYNNYCSQQRRINAMKAAEYEEEIRRKSSD